MIKKYMFSSFDNLKVGEILESILENHIVIILIQTEDVDFVSYEYLKKDELERMNKYIMKIDKMNYLITHSIVNLIFSNILKCRIEDILYRNTENGKPYIKNDKDIKFNISHSKGGAVVGLSKMDIGVDIEFVDNKFLFNDIINISFSKREIDFINNETKKFYKYWVSKESYLKYEGTGLLKDIRLLEVLYCSNRVVILEDKEKSCLVAILIYEFFENYIIGLCFG